VHRVTFVTGVSGAGKSTVARLLTEHAGCTVDDLDADGTPDAAHLDWLRWRAAQLLHDRTQAMVDTDGPIRDVPRHALICGISWPHAVIDCSAWPAAARIADEIRFVMLDVPHKVIRRRLAERNGDNGDPKGYRALLRYNRQLSEILRRQVANQRTGEVLDVADRTPLEIALYLTEGRWP
jgi:gluconate kinase